MIAQEDLLVLGCFGRAHGLKGFVHVHSYTEPPENILNYRQWQALSRDGLVPIHCLDIQISAQGILALVEGYSDRDAAQTLTHVQIAVPKTALQALPPGDYYWHELIGMQVVNQEGRSFGAVTDLLATGSNDVLIVSGEKKHLIPYLPGRFVLAVDRQLRLITVDWDWAF